MKTQAYTYKRFESRQGRNAGWQIVEKHEYPTLEIALKRAEQISADDPEGSYRMVGENGKIYLEIN